MIGLDAGETTRAGALTALSAAFAAAGIEDAATDARILVAAAAGLRREDLIRDPDRALPRDVVAKLRPLAARRIEREPVSRILARREFWGLSLAVAPEVLDPRPESETLVEAALEVFEARRGEPLRIIDLGAGSGAILCALLSELPNALGVAVEISPKAAAVARKNLAALGLAERSRVTVGCWADAVDGFFDLVVSNPPYIASAEIAALAPEVRSHDPRLALDGGPDGLDAYRAIAAALRRLIAPDGAFFLEIGAGQAAAVARLLSEAGMGDLALRRDLAGRDRVAFGRPLRAADPTSRKQAPWREAKKRLVLWSDSSSARNPSESRAAVGSSGACRAPAPNARE